MLTIILLRNFPPTQWLITKCAYSWEHRHAADHSLATLAGWADQAPGCGPTPGNHAGTWNYGTEAAWGLKPAHSPSTYSRLAKASHMANPNTTQAGRDAPLLVVVEGGMREYLPNKNLIYHMQKRHSQYNENNNTLKVWLAITASESKISR